MIRLLMLIVLAVAMLPGAALAQGNSPDSPPGRGNRPDNPPGLDNRPDPPSAPSSRPDDPPGLDNRPDADRSPDRGNASSAQDRAMEAVQTGRAVPLARVLSQAQGATGGDLIDTRLVTVQGFLLYELRMLLPDGTVDTLYYYAGTGNPVTMN